MEGIKRLYNASTAECSVVYLERMTEGPALRRIGERTGFGKKYIFDNPAITSVKHAVAREESLVCRSIDSKRLK